MTTTTLKRKKPSQKSLNADLLEAVQCGNIDEIKDAVKAGADIDMYVDSDEDDDPGMDGNTLLNLAWSIDYEDDGEASEAVMVTLIELGLAFSFDVAELMETIGMIRQHAVVQAMLTQHGDACFSDDAQHFYLAHWIELGKPASSIEDVNMFLKAGMNPLQVVQGKTLLAWAFHYKDATMVQAMLDGGASVQPIRGNPEANNLVAVWNAVDSTKTGGDYDATQAQFERIESVLLKRSSKQASKALSNARGRRG